jgi:hypothetical protein
MAPEVSLAPPVAPTAIYAQAITRTGPPSAPIRILEAAYGRHPTISSVRQVEKPGRKVKTLTT